MAAGVALALLPGDSLMFFDALTGTSISPTIAIPNDPTKARAERKIEFIVGAMAALKKSLATMQPVKVDEPILINASAFFDAIGPIVTEHSAEGVRVLLFNGSPWFSSTGSLSKKDYIGTFPSDGLLLADRSRSPLGTRGKHDLNGATVDYCYLTTGGSDAFLNPDQQGRFERAWSLLIAQRGGQLTTFSADTKTCVDRFAQSKPPEARQFALDETDSTMQYMYRTQDAAPRIVNAPPVKTGDPAPPTSSSTIREEAARFDKPGATTPPSTRTGTAWIGIQWKDTIDLDLYVRCGSSSPFLFFGNQHSPEGRHNWDFRGGTGTEFETVDLTAPCPDISRAEVFVNFYEGAVQASPKGVVAIQFNGGLYKGKFEVPALHGNLGQGLSASATMGPPYWVKIDVPTILNLNASASAHSRPRATR
jgi:hypothetical protein